MRCLESSENSNTGSNLDICTKVVIFNKEF